jgi:hypothetical protein
MFDKNSGKTGTAERATDGRFQNVPSVPGFPLLGFPESRPVASLLWCRVPNTRENIICFDDSCSP